MESLASVFGRRLRQLREVSGLTQQELGETAEVDYKHVGAIERGEKTPSFEAIGRLAQALKVDYYELFLPEELSTGDLDKDTKLLIRDIERRGTAHAKAFVRDVLAAARKMVENPSAE